MLFRSANSVMRVEPESMVMNDAAGGPDCAGGDADIVGAAETDGVVPIVAPVADVGVTGTTGVPGAICPVGVEHVTTVPGVVGSEASGTGASVVSGAPG